jgi:hypothetical protein
MFTVDDAAAAAIRRAYEEGGELAAVVEFRRHFPLIQDGELARSCVRSIASWTSSAPEGGAVPPAGTTRPPGEGRR